MSTYTESTWGSSDGTYPSVLTKRWTTTNETLVAANSDSTATGDYTFQQEWSVAAPRLNSLDAVDSDTNRSDSEVLVRFKYTDADSYLTIPYGLVVRGSGSGGSESGYVLEMVHGSNRLLLQLVEYSSGTRTVLVSSNDTLVYPMDPQSGDYIYIRFRVNGSSLKYRAWTTESNQYGSMQEPDSWWIEHTDSTHTANGWVGIFGSYAARNFETDWMSVGTNGDTAPFIADTTAETRISQQMAQVLKSDATPATRISQQMAQVLKQDATPATRISQQMAQVLYKPTDPNFRITSVNKVVMYSAPTDTPVDSDHIVPVAWRQGINSDQVILFDWNEDFFSNSTILFNWGSPLSIDHQSPIEWTLDVNQNYASPVSWRQGIATDSVIPVAWLQGIASDNQSPIIYGGEASSDSAMPFEWKAHLNIDRQIPFGWSTGIVPHDSAIPFAWRSGVASDHIPIFAWKGEPQPPPDSVIPYAWRGPFAGPGADLKIVFDWTLEFNSDSEPPTEWTLSIIEDHQIPYDWLTETGLVTLHQMPISWSSFIDIDEQIPVSWSVELNFDHVIPYQWRLTIFLELDNQMPVSWKQQVDAAGSIPVNWNLELAPDHQIPFDWLAPALDSDQPIPIGYGTRLAVNTFTPVEWTVTLDQNANLPVEWRRDVGSFHSIPVTWASPAVSTSDFVPVEWKRTIDADHQIPYQWLTESFLFSDHRMLVEYQQIFFKRFDNVIPWEAQGIGERLFEAPIAWRGDPNALQRIPFEWTDPLFALFVEDPKLCELWVADCNGIKWDAQRVAAAWKTDQLPDEPVVYPDPGLDWESPPEEIGGAWFATDCGTQWSASKCKALWLADEPQVWHADCLESQWAAQTQPDRWTAVEQGTAWEVLEPNPR